MVHFMNYKFCRLQVDFILYTIAFTLQKKVYEEILFFVLCVYLPVAEGDGLGQEHVAVRLLLFEDVVMATDRVQGSSERKSR